MTGGAIFAGLFDYLFNIISGRLLVPSQYSILVTTLAILQILLHATNVIRNVIAYYTADLAAKSSRFKNMASFFLTGFRWGWRWGIVAAVVMLGLSFPLADLLQFPSAAPFWAVALALIMLFVRPVTDGTLQGLQSFRQLAGVAVFQSILRVAAAIVLISLGLQAFGAVLALPVATFSALGLALYFLRDYFNVQNLDQVEVDTRVDVSSRYSAETFIGFVAYAIMINSDVLFTRSFFPGVQVDMYAAVVTLGKIILFVSVAVGMTLFPKAIERQANNEPVLPLLLLALGGTLAPGLAMTALYFLFPGPIVELVFRNEFINPGMILGLVGLATTLFAGINIWLNFALSTGRGRFVYLLSGIVLLQLGGMLLFNGTLAQFVAVLIAAGLLGNLSGFLMLRPQKMMNFLER